MNSISPLTEETEAEIKTIFTYTELRKGELFIDNGVMAKNIGILVEGFVRAFYRNEEGQEYNKHFFIPTCFMGGYASLISGKPNLIVQEALTDCKLWIADYKKLTALYNNHPDLERMTRIMVEHFFIQKEQREINIVLLNADKRYLNFKKEFPQLEQCIPQYHIASYLGITPTQLSRIRREMVIS